ncbi:hypothetical protein [Burkholderia singularis]|uniref:Uncharacterized protein n=1 Tax=Burkholderia singularis TaxID=1503053 RepID=A0A238HBZ7_9BURK|nr:hypothetical protein [Burkholderia singularis]SMG02507.1 hypothetical protein BSIN_5156 [Burkholderia singularis]
MRRHISRTQNPLLDVHRKMADDHNAWQQRHLLPPRRHKAAPRAVSACHAQTALFFTFLLAGDYVVNGCAAMRTAGNTQVRRRFHAADSKEGMRTDMAQHTSACAKEYSLPRHSGTPATNIIDHAIAIGEPLADSSRNQLFQSDHFAAETTPRAGMKQFAVNVGGNQTKIGSESRFGDKHGVKTGPLTQPSESNVTDHSQRYLKSSAPAASAGIANVRHARSVDVSPPSMPAIDQTLQGDLQIDGSSLIGARILGMRKLLGDVAKNHEDEQLLELANGIHQCAYRHPANQTAAALSLALLGEECSYWAAAHGGNELKINTYAKMRIFRESWSIALNSPSLPEFKNRTELAKDYIAENNIESKYFHAGLQKWLAVEYDFLVKRVSQYREIAIEYFKQFDKFIKQNIDATVKAKVFALADESKVGRLTLEYRPEKAWVISDASLKIYDMRDRYIGVVVAKSRDIIQDASEPALVLPVPGDRYLLIKPNGEISYVNDIVRGDEIQKGPALAALGAEFSRNITNNDRETLCDTNKKDLCDLSDFRLHSSLYSTPHRPISIRDIMEAKVKRHMIRLIDAWKDSMYTETPTDALFSFIIPFYETINKAQLDPRYQVRIQDIALDIVQLGLTLATIGSSTISFKAIRAGVRAARAAKLASATERASAIVRATLEGSKTSSFLLVAGRELTDFVIPVFTARSIFRAAFNIPKSRMAKIIGGELQKMDELFKKLVIQNTALDKIYENIALGFDYVMSPADIKKMIDERAARKIPDKLFRGQSSVVDKNYLGTPWTRVDELSRDDYLVDCIKHSARAGGSMGRVLSLSANKFVAKKFAISRQAGKLFMIHADKSPRNFRTIEDIIKNEGPRLISEGKITAGTLASAVRNSAINREEEIFYMLGSIPDEMVEIVSNKKFHELSV